MRILVTNAGGSLGQGVLRLLRKWYPDSYLIATSAFVPSAAALYANRVYETVLGTNNKKDDNGYLIKKICAEEDIELIIPCSDYETYLLQQFAGELPLIACSNKEISLAFYDKYLTSELLQKHEIPFAPTWLPSRYKQSGQDIIVKPRRGGLSNAIHRQLQDVSGFTDDFVVQKAIRGREVTIGVYVTRRHSLHGFIVFERELWNGLTVQCQVTREYDELVEDFCQRMVRNLPIQASLNIQAIVTEDEKLTPFEINGRVSGTCTIRAHLGFPDVQYLVEEYLLGKELTKPDIKSGCAVRELRDVIMPGASLDMVGRSEPPDSIEF